RGAAGSSRRQVIHGARAALGVGRAAGRPDLGGKTGFLTGPDPTRVRDLAALLAGLPERRARLVRIPASFVRAAGAVETLREALTGTSRPFNSDKAREILAGDWLCAPVLQEKLDLPLPSPLEDGLRSTWRWYQQAGW